MCNLLIFFVKLLYIDRMTSLIDDYVSNVINEGKTFTETFVRMVFFL